MVHLVHFAFQGEIKKVQKIINMQMIQSEYEKPSSSFQHFWYITSC